MISSKLYLSSTEEKIIELLSSTLEKKLPEAIRLLIFGSRARGLSNEDSDLDIAVVVKSSAEKNLWMRLWSIKWEILEKLNLEEFPLSLIFLSEEDFNSDSALIHEIKKDGVILWERN